MNAKHKIMAQLLLKWQEALVAENLSEVRAIQEEIAYIDRAKGSIKLRELERIRLRFGLHSNQIEAIEGNYPVLDTRWIGTLLWRASWISSITSEKSANGYGLWQTGGPVTPPEVSSWRS